jgi:hypothetical protein
MKDKTENNSNQNQFTVPTMEQIENLLSKIRPEPSQRFHLQIEKQPWVLHPGSSKFNFYLRKNIRVIVAAAITLGLFISFTAPSLGVLANRIAKFFTIASSDQMYVEIPVENLQPFDDQTSNTIPNVTQIAGYPLLSPSYIPTGFDFTGAWYDAERNSTTLIFESSDGSVIRISQHPSSTEYQSISVNATIEQVNIGPYVGEYVIGGWLAVNSPPQKHQSSLTITLEAVWNPENNTQFLRWEEMDMIFEILYVGNINNNNAILNKSDLVQIAESFH